MAKKRKVAGTHANPASSGVDCVGKLVTAIVDLLPMLLDCADWAVERGEDFRDREPELVVGGMNQTRDRLETLAKLLTEVLPLERERMKRCPYQTDYGTRLDFRELQPLKTKYRPGDWTEDARIPLQPLRPGQYPSVIDKLLEKQELCPTRWLHSARGAVLTYAADFWYAFGVWDKLGPTQGFGGWPLDMPAGERLAVRDDIFPHADAWLGWGRCAADFPRLVNVADVKEWIVRESQTSRPEDEFGRQGAASDAKGKRVSWQEARQYLDECRLRGEPFTSYADMAARMECSTATIHKAISNGQVELQDWADKQHGPSRLNVSPKAADVVLRTTPQSCEPAPGETLEQADEDAALEYLLQEARKAGPEEVARIQSLDPAARRMMAEIVYRDPDKAEQIERYRQAARVKTRD